MKLKRACFLGILGSFFFASTFILNRSMHISGGSWIWSACLRYLFAFPMMALIIWKRQGFQQIHQDIASNPKDWILWSTVGFGFFYAPLCFAGNYGESWLIASSWQVTIVMGILLAPMFHTRIEMKNLYASSIILFGVFLLQKDNIFSLDFRSTLLTALPILIASISYPLGNRKTMLLCKNGISTIERTYGMSLCSLPFWLLMSAFGVIHVGLPSWSQMMQAFGSALFSGVIATLLFFKATDLVKSNQRHLAFVESTQSGEVLFTLLGGVMLLGDVLPDYWGGVGIFLIVFGMILNSLISSSSKNLE